MGLVLSMIRSDFDNLCHLNVEYRNVFFLFFSLNSHIITSRVNWETKNEIDNKGPIW